MAGIGFELQKVLKRGGLGSFVKVALSGVVIVAGPWLLSILGIFLIGRFAAFALREGRGMFMAVIVYSYAFSLFLFGGSHYIFTRFIADLIFQDKKRECGSALILFSGIVLLLSTAVAAAAVRSIQVETLSHPLLFQASAVLLFAAINLMWLLMIFISLLKQYLSIFVVFVAGMTGSVIGTSVLGARLGLGGALLGFAAGQALIAVLLFILALGDYRPGRFRQGWRNLLAYFPKYRFLFLTGLFYYWAIWIDKIVFWIGLGRPIAGTFFRLFDAYDITVYFSNLTIIPGLVFFVIICETGFYTHLKEFLIQIGKGTLQSILKKKYRLIRGMKEGLREQILFQAVFTAVFILLAPRVSQLLLGGAAQPLVLRTTLLAVFFQLVYLTLMTFLFYFELYGYSFLASMVFFLVNLAGSLIILASQSRQLYGLSYLCGGLAAALVAAWALFSTARSMEQRIFIRYVAD